MKHKLELLFSWSLVFILGIICIYWHHDSKKKDWTVNHLIIQVIEQNFEIKRLTSKYDSLQEAKKNCVSVFISQPFTRDGLNSWYTKSCGTLYVDSPIRVMQNKNAVGWGNQEEGKVNVAEYSKNIRLYIDSVARKPAKVIINTNHLGEKVFTDH